jgi:hypothetical protein
MGDFGGSISGIDVEGSIGCGGCQCCHFCGNLLESQMDGLEYCSRCRRTRNYRSHTGRASGDLGPCPTLKELTHLRTLHLSEDSQ